MRVRSLFLLAFNVIDKKYPIHNLGKLMFGMLNIT